MTATQPGRVRAAATQDHSERSVVPPACQVVTFLHETGHLKHTRREGWWIAGIIHPESVAEHSFRTAVIGYLLAVLEGANPERTAILSLFHDLAEARLSDVPSIGKRYLSAVPAEHVVEDQTAELPPVLGRLIRDTVAEFQARQTPEAICAKDADRLECLLQAREYRAAGNTQLQPWIDTMRAAVTTTAARQLADAATETNPNKWWHHIVSSYVGTRTHIDPPIG